VTFQSVLAAKVCASAGSVRAGDGEDLLLVRVDVMTTQSIPLVLLKFPSAALLWPSDSNLSTAASRISFQCLTLRGDGFYGSPRTPDLFADLCLWCHLKDKVHSKRVNTVDEVWRFIAAAVTILCMPGILHITGDY
jgi:hypothetical protein